MIAVIYGTTGELIKLAPVLARLRELPTPMVTLCTGQQIEQIPRLLSDFDLPQPDLWLGRGNRGRDLERAFDLPRWLVDVVSSFLSGRSAIKRQLREDQIRPLVIVHGDTFTTVAGALIGRALRVEVAHIEAGIRSGDWRNPFPEELDRRVATRVAQIHFAPSAEAAANLHAMRAGGAIIDTGGNTISDALAMVPAGLPEVELPSEPFGLVSIHRFELLRKPSDLQAILELLQLASRRVPLLFIDHPVTAAAIAQYGFGPMFDDRFRRVPRQRYFAFIALLKASAFLVTDSGGSQEECAELGHPCLVHRARTERPDGLGGPVLLSGMDLELVRTFLRDPLTLSRPPRTGRVRPTDVIVDYLGSNAYLPPSSAVDPKVPSATRP